MVGRRVNCVIAVAMGLVTVGVAYIFDGILAKRTMISLFLALVRIENTHSRLISKAIARWHRQMSTIRVVL